jgi:hypothetical protein
MSANGRTGELVMTSYRALFAALVLVIFIGPSEASAQAKRATPDLSSKAAQQRIQSLLDQINALQLRLYEQAIVLQQSEFEADADSANFNKFYIKGVTITLVGLLVAESIERQHTAEIIWTRQPQNRLVRDFPRAISVDVSLETPTESLAFNTPTAQTFDCANTLSRGRSVEPQLQDFRISAVAGIGRYQLPGESR